MNNCVKGIFISSAPTCCLLLPPHFGWGSSLLRFLPCSPRRPCMLWRLRGSLNHHPTHTLSCHDIHAIWLPALSSEGNEADFSARSRLADFLSVHLQLFFLHDNTQVFSRLLLHTVQCKSGRHCVSSSGAAMTIQPLALDATDSACQGRSKFCHVMPMDAPTSVRQRLLLAPILPSPLWMQCQLWHRSRLLIR